MSGTAEHRRRTVAMVNLAGGRERAQGAGCHRWRQICPGLRQDVRISTGPKQETRTSLSQRLFVQGPALHAAKIPLPSSSTTAHWLLPSVRAAQSSRISTPRPFGSRTQETATSPSHRPSPSHAGPPTPTQASTAGQSGLRAMQAMVASSCPEASMGLPKATACDRGVTEAGAQARAHGAHVLHGEPRRRGRRVRPAPGNHEQRQGSGRAPCRSQRPPRNGAVARAAPAKEAFRATVLALDVESNTPPAYSADDANRVRTRSTAARRR